MRKKTLTYSGFIVASLLIVLVFVTARTYVQLGIAVLLYPVIAYFALRLFPRKSWKAPLITVEIPKATAVATTKTEKRVEIADIDKRAFLKLIGAAGISFFIFSILNRRADAMFFGKAAANSGAVVLEDTEGHKINPAERQPTDGYKISEIDEDIITYYGFTNKDGAWLIMREDTDTSSFRYAKGETGFPNTWTGRERLKYDYFHNVF